MVLTEKRKLYLREWRLKRLDKDRKGARERQRKWRLKNPELAKVKDKEKHLKRREERNKYSSLYYTKHSKSIGFKKKRNTRSLKYYYQNKWKVSARRKVRNAIKSGKLIRPSNCSRCFKESKIEAHHPNLKEALKIIWLCKKCHMSEYYKPLQTLTKN